MISPRDFGKHPPNVDELLEIHNNHILGKISLNKLANMLHIRIEVLKSWFIKHNLEYKVRRHEKWTKEERIQLHREYIESNESLSDFAKRVNLTGSSLWAIFKTVGLRGRSKSDSLRIRGQKYREENHPNWKGGRVTTEGYVMIYSGLDSNGKPKYVREHRKVWEEANGPIPKGWHIHHINGIKTDNRLENLVAMSHKNHAQYIPMLKEKIASLEDRLAAITISMDAGVVDY